MSRCDAAEQPTPVCHRYLDAFAVTRVAGLGSIRANGHPSRVATVVERLTNIRRVALVRSVVPLCQGEDGMQHRLLTSPPYVLLTQPAPPSSGSESASGSGSSKRWRSCALMAAGLTSCGHHKGAVWAPRWHWHACAIMLHDSRLYESSRHHQTTGAWSDRPQREYAGARSDGSAGPV